MDTLFNLIAEPLSHDFMRRALVGGLLLGFLNGFLGCFIVLRRMSLMADALSHSMLPGLAVGVMLFGLSPLGLFASGLVAAFFVAVGAQLLARGSRLKEETALAILYTMAFSIGIVLLSFVKVKVSLMHYLFGDILAMSNADLWISYGVTLLVVPVLLALQRPLLLTLFDPAVARSQGIPVHAVNLLLLVCSVLTMLCSVQAVGVILMLGLLVGPAATMYLLTDSYSKMLWGSAALGATGAGAGLLLSYRLDNVPSGACIVLVLGALFCLSFVFSPRYGLLSRLKKARHFHDESLARWPGGHEEK